MEIASIITIYYLFTCFTPYQGRGGQGARLIATKRRNSHEPHTMLTQYTLHQVENFEKILHLLYVGM